MLNSLGFLAETAIVYSESRCIVFKLALYGSVLTIRNYAQYIELSIPKEMEE